MRGEDGQLMRRLDELAMRASHTGRCFYTSFLTPPEAGWAQAAANRQHVHFALEGGYADAERCMACFWDEDPPSDFPICALEFRWPHQIAPGHRDVLGSVMGLGIQRACVGDIVLEEERGYLFAERAMAEHIAATLISAGRTRLQVRRLETWPVPKPPQGVEMRDTVSSLRLDAMVAAGFHLSRADAAELVSAGQVKLRHLPVERCDARVGEGDAISVRGYGRLLVQEVGSPNKKSRLPVRLIQYGVHRN